jgi:hypothetical protein
MKASTISILVFVIFNCPSVQAQTLDTLIDVGGYKLHFIIFKGKGIPILFEAGGGEDATTWKKIIHPVAERTAATLITYDRAGFGKSSFDTTRINHQNTDSLKASNPGSYYQGADFSNNIERMRKFPFPTTIPVTDFVSDYPPFQDSTDINDWKRCHREFAATSSNRIGILASRCGHFIFNDNPQLVINVIVKVYAYDTTGQ